MTTVLTKTWIHDDERVHPDTPPNLLVAPVKESEPRRLFGAPVTWTSPEGTRIIIDSKAKKRVRRRRRWRRVPRWKPGDIYSMLQASGLDSTIGPHLTVRVQDQYGSQASVSVGGSGGTYTSFSASIWLKGVQSSFRSSPESTLMHEYGHVFSYWQLYMVNQGDWSRYLDFRGLVGNPNLDTTYAWDRDEIIAEDFRLTGDFKKAISQRPTHLNNSITHPKDVPGLGAFLRETWTKSS